MKVRALDDAERFLAEAGELLGRDEARHNLILGLADTLVSHPDFYPRFHLWVIEDGIDVVGAATMTPPNNLVLARPEDDRTLEALADHLIGIGITPPGVVGAVPEVHRFAEVWTSRTGVGISKEMGQGIYRLTEIEPAPGAPGMVRIATDPDRSLVRGWLDDFRAEAVPDQPRDDERIERELDVRLSPGIDAAFWLWEDGGDPVSLAGFGARTPNGIRVGPVYTPPELRGRGYATTLVARMSAWLLAHGRRFCFLYTDLSNPTSNRIYRRIGYEHVCDSADVRFATT